MRLLLCALLVSMLIVSPVRAQESPAKPESADRVAIVEDDAIGAVRIIIDGKEVARIDGTGLHVRQSINYGGVTNDYSPEGFDKHVAGEQP